MTNWLSEYLNSNSAEIEKIARIIEIIQYIKFMREKETLKEAYQNYRNWLKNIEWRINKEKEHFYEAVEYTKDVYAKCIFSLTIYPYYLSENPDEEKRKIKEYFQKFLEKIIKIVPEELPGSSIRTV